MTLHDKTFADAVAPLSRAKAMPPEVYTSPQVFAEERERILLRHWFFLCREEQLPKAGDYRAFDTPGGPVVLVRGEDMRLRCFANYCRHRGSILLEGEGNYRPGPLSHRDDMVQALGRWIIEHRAD